MTLPEAIARLSQPDAGPTLTLWSRLDRHSHDACAFCAAPAGWVVKLLDSGDQQTNVAACGACHWAFMAQVDHREDGELIPTARVLAVLTEGVA